MALNRRKFLTGIASAVVVGASGVKAEPTKPQMLDLSPWLSVRFHNKRMREDYYTFTALRYNSKSDTFELFTHVFRPGESFRVPYASYTEMSLVRGNCPRTFFVERGEGDYRGNLLRSRRRDLSE
jgi:hypothetical protein